MRFDFKFAILSSGLRQYQVDQEMDWAHGKTSRVIAEIYNPTKEEREALAAILGQSVCDVFPERIIMPSNEHSLSPEAET